ncbi:MULTISPECIES: DUF6694 family lipoprotein [unclassified Gilliamella]|uniref:DUF6694 family lipoprotein n=1 Tax=unclassified Gilliamella TaxID=2685620 RepID=UPI001C6A4DD7|nr:DUF6694 family lipoprotein [Gilliamella sp. ESL0441]QYN44230.1 hypothetical protein GYM75_04885 [Gilliamella sp. ESL0441]
MFKKLLAVFVVSFVLVGCGDGSPKVDASSKSAFQASMKEISETLKGEDSDNFKKAILKIVLAASFETGGDEAKIQQILEEKLDGKTAKEILKEYSKSQP